MTRERRRAIAVVVAFALSAGALLIAACSGGSSSTDNNNPTTPGNDGSIIYSQGDGGTSPVVSDGGIIESDAYCFERTDNANLTFAFVEQTSPPSFNDATTDYVTLSSFYPGTYFTTRTITELESASSTSKTGYKFKKGYYLWANRCADMTGVTTAGGCTNTANVVGNPYTNPAMISVIPVDAGVDAGMVMIELRPMFSSYARANACTSMQAQRVLGVDTATIQTAATAAGVTLYDSADRTSLPAKATKVKVGAGNQTYLVDYCILEQGSEATDSDGIFMDYEVVDFRTPAEATAFFQAQNTLVTGLGKNLYVFTDDISTTTEQAQSGIDSTNVGTVLDTISGLAISVSSGATAGDPALNEPPQPRTESPYADYQAELAVMTNNGGTPLTTARKGKVLLAVSLFDTQLSEAQQLHNEIGAQGYQGAFVWRNSALQGGSCALTPNQIIACLAFGTCDGTFRNP